MAGTLEAEAVEKAPLQIMMTSVLSSCQVGQL